MPGSYIKDPHFIILISEIQCRRDVHILFMCVYVYSQNHRKYRSITVNVLHIKLSVLNCLIDKMEA